VSNCFLVANFANGKAYKKIERFLQDRIVLLKNIRIGSNCKYALERTFKAKLKKTGAIHRQHTANGI
jgi:hypothetical protein